MPSSAEQKNKNLLGKKHTEFFSLSYGLSIMFVKKTPCYGMTGPDDSDRESKEPRKGNDRQTMDGNINEEEVMTTITRPCCTAKHEWLQEDGFPAHI